MTCRPALTSILITTVAALTGCTVPEGPPTIGDPLPELAYPVLEAAPVQSSGDGSQGSDPELVAQPGDTVRFSDYRGSVVLVNLWATWCPPCRFETPYLQELYQEYHDRGFEIAGVSTDSRSAIGSVLDFTSEKGVEYDILLDPSSQSTGVFGVFGLPASILVDRKGVIRWMVMGPLLEGDEEFLSALNALLDESP